MHSLAVCVDIAHLACVIVLQMLPYFLNSGIGSPRSRKYLSGTLINVYPTNGEGISHHLTLSMSISNNAPVMPRFRLRSQFNTMDMNLVGATRGGEFPLSCRGGRNFAQSIAGCDLLSGFVGSYPSYPGGRAGEKPGPRDLSPMDSRPPPTEPAAVLGLQIENRSF